MVSVCPFVWLFGLRLLIAESIHPRHRRFIDRNSRLSASTVARATRPAGPRLSRSDQAKQRVLRMRKTEKSETKGGTFKRPCTLHCITSTESKANHGELAAIVSNSLHRS